MENKTDKAATPGKKASAPAKAAATTTAAAAGSDETTKAPGTTGQAAAAAGAGDTKATAKPGDKKTAKKVPALKVSCSREGFRRGGRVWGKEPEIVKLSDLTGEQIAQIVAEPLLAVVETEVDE